MQFNINDVINSIDEEIIKNLEKHNLWNYQTYGLQHGYNWILSGRGGGKSTGIQTISIKAFELFGCQTVVLRANKDETVRNIMSTYFDNMKTIIYENGENIIQKLTNGKYNTVYYLQSKKSYVLGCENDNMDDVKNRTPFMVMSSFDKSSDLCSGWNFPNCNIIFCEECLDDKIPYNALISLEHIISTVFRQRTNTSVILTGNLGRGTPRMLCDMKLYDKIKTAQVPFLHIKTKYNSHINVELFDSLPEKDSEKQKFNDMYFCFDIEGEDIVRGSSNSIPLFRQLNDSFKDVFFQDTGLYLYTLNRYFKVQSIHSSNFQEMFFVKQIDYLHQHDTQHVTLTDDEYYSYNTPYTYINPLKKYPLSLEFIKAVRRKDVCFDDYMSCVATTNLLDTFFIPQNI